MRALHERRHAVEWQDEIVPFADRKYIARPATEKKRRAIQMG